MSYEPRPHGGIDDEGSFNFPIINLIVWVVIILYFWYKESHTVKKMTYKQAKYSWDKPEKIEMHWTTKFLMILRCLLTDIKANPYYSLGCITLIMYFLIKCFV